MVLLSFRAICLGLVAGGMWISSASIGFAEMRPTPAVVLADMERVADWQLTHPSTHPADDWTQAAGDTGFMALAEISTASKYLDAMAAMANSNHWNLGSRLYHADDHCIGQTYIELFLRQPELQKLEQTRRAFDAILAAPKEGDLDFNRSDALDRWVWCDSLFMSPPTWTRLYYVTGKQVYLDYMIIHWWKTSDFLYDPVEHLFYRDSRAFTQREANGRKIFWSRGNGWVLAGLARVLDFFPLARPERPKFEAQFRAMAERILALQQTDGLWRSSLLDPEDYPMRETSGSAFFCFGLAWGVNHGLLDRAQFEPAILKAWAALNACVKQDGQLTFVQPIGFTPKSFDPNSTEIYGVGGYLLAGRQLYQLVGGRVPRLIPGT